MMSKIPFVPFEGYCLRTPSLPYDFLQKLLNSNHIESSLKEVIKIPFIRESIYLASPDLFIQMKLWEEEKIKDLKKSIRVKFSLLRYLTRISSRCTPFGLFAGCSIGQIADKNLISLKGKEHFKKDSRFDMHFLVSLTNNFSKREHIKNQLRYYPNSTLYKLGVRYRYVEYAYENKQRYHSIESVLNSPYLEGILKKAKNGAKRHDLVVHLASLEIVQSEAILFINQLIENQILISEIEPTVAGKDFLIVLKDKLSSLRKCDSELEIIDTLCSFQKNLTNIDLKDLNIYKVVSEYISSLNIDFEPKYLIQTDIYPKFSNNQISKSVLKRVKLGLRVINKMNSQKKNLNLEKFKTDFSHRYDAQKLPLLNVLDIESGIGYANSKVAATPFLDNIKMPIKTRKLSDTLTPFEELLLNKLQNCFANGSHFIELTDSDLKTFEENWKNAPDTISLMTEIIIEEGREKVFMDSIGAHAARLLARFSMGNRDIKEFVNQIMEKEKHLNPDCIIAEIVHIPESRTGNILRRPHLRENEIPCLGFSSLPISHQISLKNILVSLEGNQIVLWQKNTGKRILPRLSNAHNYSLNPLPVYQFLCDLQYQNQVNYSFHWGEFISQMEYLPRLIYKDIIISKARWKIKDKNLENFKNVFSELENTDLIKKISYWKRKLNIPEQVQLVEVDNTLLIDFSSIWSVQMLFENVKNKKIVLLQEVLEDEDPLVRKDNSYYKNEFIFSFYNDLKSFQN